VLFKKLSVDIILTLFEALVSERRIIVVSKSLAVLSSCVHAISAMVWPFTWQVQHSKLFIISWTYVFVILNELIDSISSIDLLNFLYFLFCVKLLNFFLIFNFTFFSFWYILIFFFVFWFVLKQQHVFIPILPPSLIDYTCAPMPFLVGILHSSLDALYSLPLEEVLPLRCYILMFLCFSFLSLIWGVSRSTELISYVVDVDDVRCILSI
jgi:hypothetical protein